MGPGHECAGKPQVTWSKGEVNDRFPVLPPELGVLDAPWGAGDLDSDEVDHELASRIVYGKEDLAHTGHLHGELFAELPAHGFQVGFPGLDLAPGKLPEAAMSLVGGALGQKEPSTICNDSSEDPSRHSVAALGRAGRSATQTSFSDRHTGFRHHTIGAGPLVPAPRHAGARVGWRCGCLVGVPWVDVAKGREVFWR